MLTPFQSEGDSQACTCKRDRGAANNKQQVDELLLLHIHTIGVYVHPNCMGDCCCLLLHTKKETGCGRAAAVSSMSCLVLLSVFMLSIQRRQGRGIVSKLSPVWLLAVCLLQ